MSAYSSVGVSQGLNVGFAAARERRYRDAQDALKLKEIERQHKVEDFNMERARVAAQRADEQYPADVAERDWQRGRERTIAGQQDTTFQQQQEDSSFNRARAGVRATQEDTRYAHENTTFSQSQEDRQKAIQAEGVHDFAKALLDGGDPNYALQRFNQTGTVKILPESFKVDPATRRVEFTDNRGKSFKGTYEDLAKVAGIVAPAPIKMGKDDRLIDPVTHKEIVGPSPEGVDADGNTTSGGRKTSPYNPETVQQNMNRDIALARGGQMDVLGNWSVADPGDRQVVNYAISLAQDMEGRLRRQVAAGVVTPGEISNAVVEATGDMPKESELAKRADAQARKDGLNPDQKAAWLEAERAHERAKVEAKLTKTEQRLIGKKAAAAPAGGDEVPTIDSDEAYRALASGKQFKDPTGKVYTKP